MAKRRKRARILRSFRSVLIAAVVLAICAWVGCAYIQEHPQDVPWTELQLDHPIGMFTGRKLAALSDDYPFCQNLMDQMAVAYVPLKPAGEGQCRRANNVRLTGANSERIRFAPRDIAPSCPVAAALTIWEDQIVQPAAVRYFGVRAVSIRHLGSYNCRQVAGSERWSEHATGNAIDIAAFTLADGKAISLTGHWHTNGPEATFLRTIRDGSCDLFATVLSPDYNAAHADHFHLDQAKRGAMDYRLCR
jgi:hypothetical protein